MTKYLATLGFLMSAPMFLLLAQLAVLALTPTALLPGSSQAEQEQWRDEQIENLSYLDRQEEAAVMTLGFILGAPMLIGAVLSSLRTKS